MSDPMDIYSKPIKTQNTKLGRLFWMQPRRKPEKPGRELIVNFDDRFPFANDFEVHFSYLVKFFEIGNFAGNHYHIKKQELFIPVSGKFTVHLENIETKEKETIKIDSEERQIFYIQPKTAHKVVSESANAVLLVLATSANIDGDEFGYVIKSNEIN